MYVRTDDEMNAWHRAVNQWKRTGDVSAMAEVAASASPPRRLMLLDSLPSSGLRNDIVHLLHRRAAFGRGQARATRGLRDPR